MLTKFNSGIFIFLLASITATLFPPYEWNYTEEGISGGYRGYSGNRVYYVEEYTSIKTYDFLFGNNQREFYSVEAGEKVIYNRSIIFSELIAEYFLIIFVSAFIQFSIKQLRSKKNIT